MRICMISREFPPDTGFGGIATFAKHLAYGLKELGHDVEVISLAKDKDGTTEIDGLKIHRVFNYPFPGGLDVINMCMPYSRYVLCTSTALWAKFAELHAQNPFDVIDAPELLAESLYAGATKAVPLAIRLYTPHSKFISEQLHGVSKSFDHEFVAMLERVAMLSADVLTSPSDDLADFVAEDLHYPRQSIEIVRNPIDPDVFCPEGPKAIEPDGRVTVLFVGRLEERKGIYYLAEAIPQVLKKCPNTRFVIIGDDTTNSGSGQHSVLADIKQILRSAGVLDQIEFIRRVPLTSLPDYYRSADICVVPSVYDNSPYTCLEAMSCGRPVIGTNAGGTREYVEHNKSGLIINAKSTPDLVDAIIELASNQSRREQLARAARERTLEKFQRKQIAAETVELYKLAQQRFRQREGKLYKKNWQEALADSEFFLYSLDRTLYQFLYQKSFRFRVRHWWRLTVKRPRLAVGEFTLLAWNQFARLFKVKPANAPRVIRQLEIEVTKMDPHCGGLVLQGNPDD